MKYFMGIDIGTFESKGLLMNENGEIVIVQSTPHIMQTPHPGYAEHDAEETWWHDFCKLSNGLIAESGIDPNDIKGVGCSAIGPCCLPVDKDCRPLLKAILYELDVPAKKQIEDLYREVGEDYVLQ